MKSIIDSKEVEKLVPKIDEFMNADNKADKFLDIAVEKAKAVISLEPKIVKTTAFRDLKVVNPTIHRAFRISTYKDYIQSEEEYFNIVKNLEEKHKFDMLNSYMSKKELEKKYNSEVAEILRSDEEKSQGILRKADTNISKKYKKVRKLGIEGKKKADKKQHIFINVEKNLTRSISPLNTALLPKNKDDINSQDREFALIVKQKLDALQDEVKNYIQDNNIVVVK